MSHNIPVLTVSELSAHLKSVLEAHFTQVLLQGEISGYKQHVSGHHYFSLKDGQSVIDAVCWRGTTLSFALSDGAHIVCQGRVTAYAGRSKYQIVVSQIWDHGRGSVLEQLERLKTKLQSEGVFDQKRPMPKFPIHLGILTSSTGSVIQDMLHRCKERWPCRITLFSIQVQGNRVARDVLEGLKFFHELPFQERPDILIIARGGGSVEDLWGFQEEIVVRAVAASKIPTVSAIGHETDTTLTDYAADLRAPTPTAAIELVLPHQAEYLKFIAHLAERMLRSYSGTLELYTVKYNHITHRWGAFDRYPEEPLMQRLDDIWEKMHSAVEHFFDKKCAIFSNMSAKMHLKWSDTHLAATQLKGWQQRLNQGMVFFLNREIDRIVWLEHRLHASSYKQVLQRGFTLAQTESGGIITSAQYLEHGDRVRLIWHDGEKIGQIV